MKKNLLMAGTLLLPLSVTLAKNQQPNIIFILADDMGYGDVSALDANGKIKTPHLDAMVRRGVTYTDAHTSSSVSTPTRYGVLTGRYNWRTSLKQGVLSGYSSALIPTTRATMGSMLQKCGYTTAAIGKWHLGWNWSRTVQPPAEQLNNLSHVDATVDYTQPVTNSVNDLGFDYSYMFCGSLDMPPYIYVENGVATAQPNRVTKGAKPGFFREGPTAADFDHQECLPHIVDKACAYVAEKAEGDQPYFLYLPFPAPHTPILPSAEFRGKSGLGAYGDFCMMVDSMVGRVVEAVEATGEADHTIIVFTADNGCSPAASIDDLIAQGHYPNSIYRGHKADLFEGGHRVPCIVTWPAKAKTHTVNQTVCLTDFYATFADVAGRDLADTEGEDSYSILPTLVSKRRVAPIREATVHHSIVGQFAIRKGEWKLLLSPSSGGWSNPRPNDKKALVGLPPMQLFHLKDDPRETTNLYAQHPEIVEELQALLVKYIRDGRSTPGAAQQNDQVKFWRQIDYFMPKD